ncbi:MAG: hypothetical protein QOI81_169, partial [Actinomycetota bacterium]|nr:hypothetical protein [Actinomycetota bacterium]
LLFNRTLMVFQVVVGPVTAEISAGGARASSTAANLKPPSGSKR